MHGKIKNYLTLSLPRLLTFRWGWIYLLTVSVINIVMVYHLHPFGEPDPLMPLQPTLLTGFAWICIVVYILLYQLLPLMMKRVYKTENWTLAHEFRTFGIYFVCMVLLNRGYALLVIPVHETEWHFFFKIVCFTLMYQLLLVVFFTLLNLTIYLFKQLMEPKSPEVIVVKEPLPVVVESLPVTVLDLTEFHGGIYPHDSIRYLVVVGNYTQIYFKGKNRLIHEIVHVSLVKVYAKLEPYSQFYHIRKNCVVNVDYVTECTGDKREKDVKILDCPKTIQVTRDNVKQLKRLLKERGREE